MIRNLIRRRSRRHRVWTLMPPADEMGPCTGCGTPCVRYGDRGRTLCEQCREQR
jgi:hypothetical protein